MRNAGNCLQAPTIFGYRRITVAGCLLGILGAKICLIAALGVETPQWDQWDGEAQAVYLPYLRGELRLVDLLALHNEHRIAFTRLSALMLLWLNGAWSPVLEMLWNAGVHVITIGVLLAIVSPLLDRFGFLFVAVFSFLFFSVPLGWQNTLFGFPTQFYALILLSLLSFGFLYGSAAWSMSWWIGTLLAVASYFTMASGALTLPAFAMLAVVQLAIGQRRGAGELAGILVHAVIFVLMLLDVPRVIVARPDWMQRELVAHVYSSLAAAAGWPVASYSWPFVLRWIPAFIMYLPLLALALRLLRVRPGVADQRWLLVLIGVWMGLQICALAYGRTGDTVESRYSDILVIGLIVNCTCLVRSWPYGDRHAPGLQIFAAIWLLAALLGGGQKVLERVADDLRWKREFDANQTVNVTRFLQSGDVGHLRDKPLYHIPYPDPDRLRDILSEPLIRSILPSALIGKEDPGRVKAAILQSGSLLLPLGIFLLMIASLAAWRDRTRPGRPLLS